MRRQTSDERDFCPSLWEVKLPIDTAHLPYSSPEALGVAHGERGREKEGCGEQKKNIAASEASAGRG